jgi:hypothetical protein
LLGVLTSGSLDDGRGLARVNLFKHKHEIDTGRTSSVGMEMMGFDNQGLHITRGQGGRKMGWDEISLKASKVWFILPQTYTFNLSLLNL